MAERNNKLLAFGLLAAVGAYLMVQSKEGQSLVRAAVDAGSEAVEGIVNVFGGSRGLRNNNPGNIVRTGTAWQGMAPDQSADSRFIVFIAPEFGIRAMARVLKNYIANGFTTVESIINRWAPPAENDTGAYVRAVASQLGVNPNAPIGAAQMPALIAAIIKHENGQQPYPPEVIAMGIELERA